MECKNDIEIISHWKMSTANHYKLLNVFAFNTQQTEQRSVHFAFNDSWYVVMFKINE